MNLISETLDQMFMATDLKAPVPKASKQLYWFSKGGLSKCLNCQHQNSLELLLVHCQSDSRILCSLNTKYS